ncbi:cell division ATP-binding protein FtsE [Candidatus Daviesbacteria bacterium RIFCSPLOWO2_01_FULL_43_38]|uniref:Cell division ATP-binding protein FtsE n=2 Tax=Candidatus Daviesiibacteriota TaxID=1752718 RepID=A0A1F5K6S6_9BACT|nr:MAG: Cell division ATP-binding protein FtsE [Candidatus Daviesbacteria bacterium GW2011_GWA2_42_7]OGE36450.1 MAG: cell division ATP-binding protein FtsE [Candidatus Daviesbacteria bacterium RIFCSPHIGHO2_12_FULL_43_11]OGE63494.1 MAG: cell division ATP-binding protein FtsE [Candidatus Daviesbacteria bacterium RIFCSPLOWO2_01_FULL_43_38]
MISFQNVTKKFSTTITAVEGINLDVKKGEFVFLVGPSGAGKSTLLRLLSREYLPTTGKVIVDEIDISKLKSSDIPIYRRKIGFVFQDFKLLEDRTVLENVALALQVREIPELEIAKEVERTLKLFEIWERRNLFPRQLSGGEAQRTAIARAIIGKPEVLLADEPTGDLDPQTAWSVLQLLGEINSWGTTVVMATHNKEIVDAQKRRVITIKGGKIIKDRNEGKYDLH